MWVSCLGRYAWSVAISAAVLAGCGGAQGAIGAPGANAVAPGGARTAPALGGAFSGAYAGTASATSCTYKPGGLFFFSGTGKSSFLGQSGESMILQPTRFCAWSGGATLQSSKHPNQEIFMSLYEGRGNLATPCIEPLAYTVHGGTGKYVHAKGTGTLTLQCSNSTYSDQWSGTISF
jgi:hypothetical protein